MAEFKIGEVNNYFSQSDVNSIFRGEPDSESTTEQKEKKKVDSIIEDIEEKLKRTNNQREQLLDQLQLLDIRIDNYDSLIIDIDKKIQPLLDPINTQINAVKAAYDARISAGCKNNLKWVPVAWGEDDDGDQLIYYECQKNALQTVTRQERLDGSIEEIKTGLTDPDTIVTGYYGYKFYRKPLNRDYGSNLIDVIIGSTTAGSTTVEVKQGGEFDDSAGEGEFELRIGDVVTDSIENPTVFSFGDLPKIIGISSSRTFTGITTTVRGNISTGSNTLSLIGIGTVDVGFTNDNFLNRLNTDRFTSTEADFAVKVGSGIERTGILPANTRVLSIGNGSTTYEIYDPQAGSGRGAFVSKTQNVTTLVLNQTAIASTSTAIFNVGITSFTPTLTLDTAANITASDIQLSIIRSAEDPDRDFDQQKNPLDPVTIGLINSNNLGVGHTSLIINNAEPERTINWHQLRSYSLRQSNGEIREYDPEPEQGAGRAVYHRGNELWPTVVTDDGDGGSDERYAYEGEVLVVGNIDGNGGTFVITDPDDDSGEGSGTTRNVSTTPTSPGITGNCTTLANNITAAETALTNIRNENLPKAQQFATQSAALRELRDDMELEAFGLLQASAAARKEIDRLTVLLNDLKKQDLESYG